MAAASSPKNPQEALQTFWSTFLSPKPHPVPTIFPKSLYASLLPPAHPHPAKPHNAAESYAAAAATASRRVARIAAECRRTNEKFTDPDFDIRANAADCLLALDWTPPSRGPAGGPAAQIADALATLQDAGVLEDANLALRIPALQRTLASAAASAGGGDDDDNDEHYNPSPQSRHRVDWIFAHPQFVAEGFSSSDIKQGSASLDCWFLSAVATIAHRADLMGRVCVARDEECGVYGFVFCRDGEWVPVVVDDYLFLSEGNLADTGAGHYDPSSEEGKRYRERYQRGSGALYFSSCKDENETWLPLMEKAYAKAHGDYNAIWGGYVGEGVEDLTGGVASEVMMEDVLSKKRLWGELTNADKDFVFGLDILDTIHVKNGLASGHAYSLIEAREESTEDGKSTVQLVKIRNPWGTRAVGDVGEWNGPWSDGSKEWTPYWMTKLSYQFGNDGEFWMTFQDMLTQFTNLYRTRLFDESWTVVQEWTSVNVAWLTGYLQRKFVVEIKQPGVAVFVLSQLDRRYFVGLEGQYNFLLHFILQKEGSEPGDYLCRVRPRSEDFFRANRSVSCEVELEAGRYEVLPKLTAMRDLDKPSVEDAVKTYAMDKPQKLRQVGLSFDLAHVKAGVPEEEVPPKKEAETIDPPAKKDEAKAPTEPKKETQTVEPDEKGEVSVPTDGVPMIASAAMGAIAEADAEGKKDEKDDVPHVEGGGGDEGPAGQDDDDDDDEKPPPWNAACVMGLRVYAKDPSVTITLGLPKNAQEAASLAVDEKTPAGTTM